MSHSPFNFEVSTESISTPENGFGLHKYCAKLHRFVEKTVENYRLVPCFEGLRAFVFHSNHIFMWKTR